MHRIFGAIIVVAALVTACAIERPAWAENTVDVSETVVVEVDAVRFAVDGCDYLVRLRYVLRGQERDTRVVCIKADRSASDRDNSFEAIGTVPQALMDDLASAKTRLDSVLAAALAAGKLKPQISR